ncbi:MAG: site-2 protease family protein [Desulfomonile tiedjei]|nr:site-2 protease family protein [Desulfomonile tiedjei]
MDTNYILAVLQKLALIAPGFLLAITVHEFTHGYVAYRLGDPTAKMAGRLTFNPISHLDLFGTLVLVLTQMIGWAKPVPVDPRYLQNPRKDMIWISLGGPAANMITATLLAVLLHILVGVWGGPRSGPGGAFFLRPLFLILAYGVQINVVLAIFNLIPVPPLDGSSILAGLLPRAQAYEYEKLQPYGFIILMLLIFTGVINYVIMPPIEFVTRLLLSGLG